MNDAAFTHTHYRAMLRAGHEAGYRFATFDELGRLRSDGSFACLIRHDCDNDLVAARDLARIEAELGVRATYFVMMRSALYNLLAPNVSALVREIVALGHRLALHFDEAPFHDAPPPEVARHVDRERDWLAREFGQPIDVVSFHQPSARVLANEIRLNCRNTYDCTDMDGLYYISDSNLRFRKETPIECFERRTNRLLHILLHPEWWTKDPMPLDAKWNQMLAHNVALMQDSLLAREDTFTRRRSVSFGGEPGAPAAPEP
jgi:peptidoglycan/xylan/chitin deacetylase (PgdA/CDA1 family)